MQGTQKVRMILNERIIRPATNRGPFSRLSPAFISTKRLFIFLPEPCLQAWRLLALYLYNNGENESPFLLRYTKIPFLLFNHRQEISYIFFFFPPSNFRCLSSWLFLRLLLFLFRLSTATSSTLSFAINTLISNWCYLLFVPIFTSREREEKATNYVFLLFLCR